MDASHSFHTLFIIHCGTLDITLGLSPFSYVSRADLHAEQITALKQTEQTKTRYCLPLYILKPLSELVEGGAARAFLLKTTVEEPDKRTVFTIRSLSSPPTTLEPRLKAKTTPPHTIGRLASGPSLQHFKQVYL